MEEIYIQKNIHTKGHTHGRIDMRKKYSHERGINMERHICGGDIHIEEIYTHSFVKKNYKKSNNNIRLKRIEYA